MTIIKKQDTKLNEQVNGLKKSIEDNNLCLAKEIEPLIRKMEKYDLEYKSQRDAAKGRNKVWINIVGCIAFVVVSSVCYYFFKFIPCDVICGIGAFSGFKTSLYEKVTKDIKPNEELEKIKMQISEIENRYKNENCVIQEKLNKIGKGLNDEFSVSVLIQKELTDKFILFNDILISTSNGTIQFDHILITPTRIICIENKSFEGIYYPNKDGWMWYPTKRQKHGVSDKGVLQPNPAKQAVYKSNNLMNFLNENQLEYKVEPIVVLSNKYAEFKGDNRFCKIISIDKLISYLRLDCTESYVINSNEANRISELLLRSSEKTAGEQYDKHFASSYGI